MRAEHYKSIDADASHLHLDAESLTLTGLRDAPRWVGWAERDGRKMPFDPNRRGNAAKADDPSTWGGLADARACAARLLGKGGKGGVGVQLGDLGNGFTLAGVDLDSCLDPATGELEGWAAEVIERFGSYAEVSPSGRGVKLFFLIKSGDVAAVRTAMGRTAEGKPRHGISWSQGAHREIALHLSNRYFAVTGRELGVDPAYAELVAVNDNLKVIGRADLLWLIREAGPAFKGGRKTKTRDDTASGALFRLARKIKLEGGSREDFEAAVADDPEAAAHAAKEGQRAVDRAWNRNPEPRDPSALFPELEDDEARALIGLDEIDPVTVRLNRHFAVVRHAGKTLTAEFKTDGSIALGGVEDLHTLYANDVVPSRDGRRMEAASKRWLTDPARREYRGGIVFDPSGRAPAGALNLWTGWAIEPDPAASCDLILAHIRDVICNGGADHYRYVIGWLADLVQNPGRKPGVALVLKGGKGAGKDTLGEVMTQIVGTRHVAHVDKPELLVARFNAHFATALMVHVEEAYWPGSPDKRGTLQALITSPTMTMEQKGIDAVPVDSYVRLFMTTNEEWAVPASHDERRYAVFDVSGERIGDRDYFDSLHAEIDNGGAAGFLAYLMALDLSGFSVRDVPQTGALRDQKIAGLRGFDRWWFDLLHEGVLPGGGGFDDEGDWTARFVAVERGALRASYENFVKNERHGGGAVTREQFSKRLRAVVPEIEDVRPRTNGGRTWCYRLPPIPICREGFNRWLGATIIWERESNDTLDHLDET